jgi:glycosyltransferase involved in cell wall biosynthesis
MKIFLVHNSYQQIGGEDVVFENERELLSAHGHDVCTYTRHNDEINSYGLIAKTTLPLRTLWAWDSAAQMHQIIRRERPDIAHFHNTFPLISPAAYYACREAEIPVVQSLHNPRLICPAATFYRDGKACVECLGKTPAWPAIRHACYRDSRAQTAVISGMLALHWYLNTWNRLVDSYIVFTDFYRRAFVDAGFPSEKIHIKPHFVPSDPGIKRRPRDYALFVGRLAPEKGVRTLLEAWGRLPLSIPLKIRGEGPLLPQIPQLSGHNIQVVPRLNREQLTALMHGARFLIWPSEGYYETFGLIAVEAFACGVPVIASRSGVMAEIIHDQRTGLHFTQGDPQDLAAKVEWAWTHPTQMAAMSVAARAEYEMKYTPEHNYDVLMEIYGEASHFKTSKRIAPLGHHLPLLSTNGTHLNESSHRTES